MARADLPPAFSDLTLDAAKKQVDGTDKVVVVKFTADWCPPCKAMDKTTWRDESVVKWVKDHGVAIQVDVDKDQKTAQAYNIEAMPTMVMLRGGKEIGRTLGYMPGPQILSWMEATATGKAPTASTSQKGGKPTKAAESVPQVSQFQLLATALEKSVAEKKYNESVAIVQEMWSEKTLNDPARLAGLVPEVREQLVTILAGAPEAKSAVVSIRDEIEQVKDDGTPRARAGELIDWLGFNSVLSDDARSLAWIDRTKSDENAAALFSIGLAEITPILIRNGRAADIAGLVPNATEALQRRYEVTAPAVKGVEKSDPARAARAWTGFETLGGQVFAGFVAAKDVKEANGIAETMLQLRDTPTMRIALVRESLNAGVVGPGAKLWLDEAAKSGQDVTALRSRLAAMPK
ncbi:MAG: thioredoxin family protein [Planctomycetes bacterium]|nr:thioredoxin family protein [Planctomycetota bacterium]